MRYLAFASVLFAFTLRTAAQSHDKQVRAQVYIALSARYFLHEGDIDTSYIICPKTKWTVIARLNVSSATIELEGVDGGNHFKSEMEADYKSTISFAVSYLSISLSTALNPAKLCTT